MTTGGDHLRDYLRQPRRVRESRGGNRTDGRGEKQLVVPGQVNDGEEGRRRGTAKRDGEEGRRRRTAKRAAKRGAKRGGDRREPRRTRRGGGGADDWIRGAGHKADHQAGGTQGGGFSFFFSLLSFRCCCGCCCRRCRSLFPFFPLLLLLKHQSAPPPTLLLPPPAAPICSSFCFDGKSGRDLRRWRLLPLLLLLLLPLLCLILFPPLFYSLLLLVHMVGTSGVASLSS